jgi:hypothetical protein
MTRLDEAFTLIEANMLDQYKELAERVEVELDRVSNLRERYDDGNGPLLPFEPDIVDGVDARTFHLPDAG